jgi:hypothetical protein
MAKRSIQLRQMLDNLALPHGDMVTMTRIDHLARSTFDLFGIVRRIVDAKTQFPSLAEPWGDTATSTGRLMIAVLGAHGPTVQTHRSPKSARRSSAATEARRLPTSPAATMSATARFPGSHEEVF